ncbi:hypothetical protein [Kordiimonas sp. SCSIO 12610]|uniref:hypothetical protein n=1 Tax=Kordiimonas sp. SCSIO 12610 TaxID=2829597 RepID=UPI00210CC2A3|nr:hypothetical protein [Kordiimonas sp. SCSIO 12610]UTW53963.1 hypothetical protein KFF44_08925 [Kordiimonas sp. SCSIO 12610]
MSSFPFVGGDLAFGASGGPIRSDTQFVSPFDNGDIIIGGASPVNQIALVAAGAIAVGVVLWITSR